MPSGIGRGFTVPSQERYIAALARYGLLTFYTASLFFRMACKQKLDLRCVLIWDPSTEGAGAKTRLRTPKAVTYHEQPHYCRFTALGVWNPE